MGGDEGGEVDVGCDAVGGEGEGDGLPGGHGGEVDPGRRLRVRALAGLQPAIPEQVVEGDHQWIAGVGGAARVHAAVLVGGVDRQQLPDPMAAGGEPLDELACGRPDLPDAGGAGEAGGVQQDPGLAGGRAHAWVLR
jgi:hypothetical protein